MSNEIMKSRIDSFLQMELDETGINYKIISIDKEGEAAEVELFSKEISIIADFSFVDEELRFGYEYEYDEYINLEHPSEEKYFWIIIAPVFFPRNQKLK